MSIPRWFSVVVTLVFALALSTGTAFAANEDTISLTSSTVVDGDSNLSVRPVIELQFSGKVDDISILQQNKDRFHLQDAAGNVLTLQVLFPDVQVQTRFVNHIFLVPAQELAPGASYTLTIDKDLSDKKFHTLDRSYRMTFTTGTNEVYARGAENEDLQSLGQDVLTYETALAPSAAVDTASVSEDTASEAESEPSSSKLLPIAIAALILLLGAVGYWNYCSSRPASTDE